ncbi:hypothetical protein HZ989_13095 [Brevundimonas sp. AJA228-03]|uniref:hypothetical protein n=1 Tax=Brevundimonas sp. AJA228-03 TaxID=2752515 RepID=UPI001ADEFE50|nr:hypothetical protein [Brevundimonas sp. AJA228-03]QTN19145.1 hypothetical protein HZ989_13095 [Brevundimonas sp. AJA228-03]
MTALFGFSAIFVGAAFAWSLVATIATALAAITGSIPERQFALSVVLAGGGAIVLAVCIAWLFGLFVWLRRLPSLRVTSAALIAAPFLLGALPFGWGLLSSM